ncbi:MAG: PLP-dependent transferase [Saprospiraceae bacterium]|uniref:trans-sulfuration enzyme family protein n=1 Tax=Candidatus Brachybacter algidus TaxID=2982024 RepID=UPI001B3F48B7|nr:PLP-dependent transferase [Candidatus Brachybacter algidus]MBP7306946.1 PLP-dependent transferase [Saprospiraceae bacterium]MBK6450476.1 PLP-dependent transferase [Candidatus Brachybacter algidus]MBK7605250.1 PLP-dependent transferase [Candidatus Brachybacter algidus]MBK8356145.1 PLP-dependent transferase [Candidatus Brachybacter algidus]
MKFNSKVIHAGVSPDPSTGAIMTPIFQTSTYVQDEPGVHKGHEYGRTSNPTRSALEANLAALENGKYGLCFSSGLGAMDTLLKMLNPGDEIISTNDLYGGSYRLMTRVYGRFGIKSHFIDLNDTVQLEKLINPRTRLIWIETPTNPMLNIVDIRKVTKIAEKYGIITCVDNTFASPYLQRPLDLGADIILHSCTKYLGGHSDAVLGALVCNKKEIDDQLRFLQNACGATPGPMDCFLILRGIKTLHIRMKRACRNAGRLAEFLKNHPAINKVNYPGFKTHPSHQLASTQMSDYGAMVSFDLKKDSLESAIGVLKKFKMFSLAESLGGVESLVGHPSTMTHASIPREERLKVGLTDSLIRLSVGIEDIEDLMADLDQALS